MIRWLQFSLMAASLAVIILFFSLILGRICCQRKRTNPSDADQERAQTLQNIHQTDRRTSKKGNYSVLRSGLSGKSVFIWADNPSLVSDAVENGWSRFAFSTQMSSPSVRSGISLLGACAAGDQGREMEVQMGWEVCQGSSEFLQRIRLNPGLKKISKNWDSMGAVSVIRTALPLPGPSLRNSAFPQEAYFEITMLSPRDVDQELTATRKEDKAEGEKINLIQEDFNAKVNSESLIHVKSVHSYRNRVIDEMKKSGKESGKIEGIVLSVGLAGGGSSLLKLPGSYPGSIGFNSNGSVFLDGIKLASESEKEEWGRSEMVIGCGYNPSQKKVFFTVDSQLMHEIHCKSEAFSSPLYPTLAANADIVVLVNLGQCPFKYARANLQRTPNPCFNGPLGNSPALGYEDSRELFSIGRIDSQWLNRITNRSTTSNGTINKGLDYDEESEGDLFEIVLDSSGRSPHTQ